MHWYYDILLIWFTRFLFHCNDKGFGVLRYLYSCWQWPVWRLWLKKMHVKIIKYICYISGPIRQTCMITWCFSLEGIVRFAQTIKLYEKQDAELAKLNTELFSVIMPQMAAPAPPQPQQQQPLPASWQSDTKWICAMIPLIWMLLL